MQFPERINKRIKNIPLDDLNLFLAVAETGSPSAAAGQTGTSIPTLGRRHGRLESTLGQWLFLHGPAAYALTADGPALADEALPLRTTAERISRWRDRKLRAIAALLGDTGLRPPVG
ncbi:helix-turn-helix domain-containing protein [Tropicimonas sp.]|uniref:helix-turn-helix domain-containing protein n=1 Tax=Tropicimonas sp. TaxID=2067044 RepID=UPI003A8390EF